MNMKNKVNDVSSVALISALQEKYKLPPATANAMDLCHRKVSVSEHGKTSH